jgi:hypothetical protein
MNISKLELFSLSLIIMVYVPVSKPAGTVQGRENVPDVRGVANDITSSSLSLVILTSSQMESDCPTPLIITVSPMLNCVSSICNVKLFPVGIDTLISTLLLSRRLCAVTFHVPSAPSGGIPISFVEKLPELSEKVSVLVDMFPEGSRRVIVNLALLPVFPITKIDSPGE